MKKSAEKNKQIKYSCVNKHMTDFNFQTVALI